MASLRYHYHCEQCEATWLTEAEVDTKIEAVTDCRFCGAQDIFSYRSDGGRIGRANLRTKLAVVEGAAKSKTPARAGKLKRSA
jgi:hypothetical protein